MSGRPQSSRSRQPIDFHGIGYPASYNSNRLVVPSNSCASAGIVLSLRMRRFVAVQNALSQSCLLACASCLVLQMATIAWAQFPGVKDLPVRPEMPDPLVMLNGERVTTREQWVNQRRPELKALFQHYMYGEMPAAPGNLVAKVAHQDPKAFGGKATLKEVTLTFGPPQTPPVHLLLVVPNRPRGTAAGFPWHELLRQPCAGYRSWGPPADRLDV